MSNDPPPSDDSSREPAEAGSFLDHVLMKDGAESDDGEYGLELDASQAEEVRQIFFTTLPQYLEPIEQMLDQLFAGDQIAQDLCTTLITTVSSIAAAAARIGVPNALERLERMQDALLQLVDHAGAPPLRVRDTVLQELLALRALTGSAPAPTATRSQTIVAAFQHLKGIDRSVLEKLTAAGLVTVDQIEMAEPREIAAVTGLPMPVVQQLIAALLGAGAAASVPEPNSDDAGASLEAELRARLGALVDAEAALQEAQATLSRLQSIKAGLQRELSAAVAERDGMRAQFEAARTRLGARLGEVAKVESERSAAQRELATVEGALQRTRAYVTNLSQEQRAARAAYTHCAQELTSIAGRVRRLVETAVRKLGENGPRRRAQEDPDR
jgi:hypothetical protein